MFVACGVVVRPDITSLEGIVLPGEPRGASYDVIPLEAVRITGVHGHHGVARQDCVAERCAIAQHVALVAEAALWGEA